jgi:DNA-binding NtrC family response regulator
VAQLPGLIVLVAEARPEVRRRLADAVHRAECAALAAGNQEELARAVEKTPPDVALIGALRSGDWSNLELAGAVLRERPGVRVVFLAEQGSEELAVAALRLGVSDYLPASGAQGQLPETLARLAGSIARAADGEQRGRRPRSGGAPQPEGAPQLVGDSPAMLAVRRQVSRAARVDCNVLVTGETGSGKELVAELVHLASDRAARPLVRVNCAAIPGGLLESELFGHERGAFTGAVRRQLGSLQLGEGGTVFLDEIGDLPVAAQAKILGAVERKEFRPLGGGRSVEVDARLIAATNQDLEKLIAEKRFREDLYYRLNVARIELPPLRERKEDIAALCVDFITGLNARYRTEVRGLTPETLRVLMAHDWPGNVRELRNVLEAAFVNQPFRLIEVTHLPESFLKRFRDVSAAAPAAERDRLLWALHAANWNKSKAAQKLRWSRMTLYRKMAQYEIASEATDGARACAEPVPKV